MKKNLRPLSAERTAELQRLLSQHGKKAKTSVSLSGELLRATDVVAGKAQRSALVERALRRYLKFILRRARHQRDVALIAARAALTNRESDQVLSLQAWPE
jgi:metal-responsive CopG/Arc/MetJ family transcriptional regulator